VYGDALARQPPRGEGHRGNGHHRLRPRRGERGGGRAEALRGEGSGDAPDAGEGMESDAEREGRCVIPSSFEYARAGSVEEALRLLKEAGGEAKLLAGGHSLLPMMKIRLTSPGKLIDIRSIRELRGIRREGNRLVVGALT